MFINIDKNAQTSHSKEVKDTSFVAVEEIGSTPNPAQANIGEPEPATHRENRLREREER